MMSGEEDKLTHIDGRGEAAMVDVSAKAISLRTAKAAGTIFVSPETVRLIESNQVAKGNVLATARLAGIMAAKRTGELIPLAHPLPITHCQVEFNVPEGADRIEIVGTARISAKTGVEMEALTAVSVAALTIYDMCKAVDRGMSVGEIRLLSKEKIPGS